MGSMGLADLHVREFCRYGKDWEVLSPWLAQHGLIALMQGLWCGAIVSLIFGFNFYVF